MITYEKNFGTRRAPFGALVVPAALLAAGLSGCLTDKGDGGGTDSLQTETAVVATTPPTATAPGMIVTHEVEYDCRDGSLQTYEYDDTTYYALAGGKLFLWSERDCLATVMNGSSTTIQGTWTTTDLFPTDSVPAAYRDPGCDPEGEDVDEEFVPYFESMTARYTITSTSIRGTVSGTICYGPVIAAFYEYDEYYEVLSSGCDEVRIRHVLTDRTATFSLQAKGDEVMSKFSYAGKTCTRLIPLAPPDESLICAEVDAREEAYETCVAESGFYIHDGSVGHVGKRASPDGVSKALRKAFRRMPSPLP